MFTFNWPHSNPTEQSLKLDEYAILVEGIKTKQACYCGDPKIKQHKEVYRI